jgi:hypothetical protein
MNVKEAVQTAKQYTADLLADEGLSNLGLEEVEWNERDESWRVTVGFSRPWNSVRTTVTAITGEPNTRRTYRVVTLRNDGTVVSMRRRENVDE